MVVLGEVDLISLKDRNKKISYLLSRSTNNFRGLRSHSLSFLKKIAGLTVKEVSSDVHVTIKISFYSVTDRDRDVRECFERAMMDIYKDLVDDLNNQNLLILKLKAVVLGGDKFIKDVFRIYSKLALSLGEKYFSYVYFHNSLSYLQGLGLVVLLSTKVNWCYTIRVNLLFSEMVLEKIYRTRFTLYWYVSPLLFSYLCL